jgi:hypothetical protein
LFCDHLRHDHHQEPGGGFAPDGAKQKLKAEIRKAETEIRNQGSEGGSQILISVFQMSGFGKS